MSEDRPQSDEIDFFELCELLWSQKRILFISVAVAALCGLIFSQLVPRNYEVSIPYYINIYSVSAQQFCGKDVPCLEERSISKIIESSKDDWSVNLRASEIKLVTDSPSSIAEYDGIKEDMAKKFASDVYQEATSEAKLILAELDNDVRSTDVVAANLLNAKRILRNIENGGSVVDFGSARISDISPGTAWILVLFMLVGGVSGASFIVLRNAFRKRRG